MMQVKTEDRQRQSNARRVLHSFRELVRQADELGLSHNVEPDNIYWVPNEVLRFDKPSNGKRPQHERYPVIVVRVQDNMAEVCIRTSQVSRNRGNNGLYHPASLELGLDKPGIILTKKFGRRWLELTRLDRSNYSGSLDAQYHQLLQEMLPKQGQRDLGARKGRGETLALGYAGGRA